MEEKKHASQEQVGIVSKILKVASIPAGIGTGYWFAKASVSDAAYDRAKRNGFFSAKKVEQAGVAEAASEAVKPVKIIESMASLGKTFEEQRIAYKETGKATLSEVVPALDKLVNTEIKQHMKDVGLGSFRKQWKFVHASDKNRALLDAFTAAGITIGAVLAVSNSRTLSALFTDKDDKERS